MRQLEALYFPYAMVRDSIFLKSALLYFDKLWVISSGNAFYETKGEFKELLQDRELVEWINGEALANNYQSILLNAISTDLSDNEFLGLTQRQHQSWEIYEDKGLYAVESLIKPLRARGSRVLVPYQQGEAFLLNMALLATSDPQYQRLTPLTDREEHFSILQHKLRRGAKSQLERLYGETIERGQREALVSLIGRELVRAVLPAPERMRDIPLERIKEFRNRYREDRDKLRDRLLLMIEEILSEEPSISPVRIQQRIEALLNFRLRRLEYDRAWSTRILGGLRAGLGVAKAAAGALKTALTGVPIWLALAGEAPAAGEILDYIQHQASQLRTSDVTYLYRVRGEFRQQSN